MAMPEGNPTSKNLLQLPQKLSFGYHWPTKRNSRDQIRSENWKYTVVLVRLSENSTHRMLQYTGTVKWQIRSKHIRLLNHRRHAMRRTAGQTDLELRRGLFASLNLDPCCSLQPPLHQKHNQHVGVN